MLWLMHFVVIIFQLLLLLCGVNYISLTVQNNIENLTMSIHIFHVLRQ